MSSHPCTPVLLAAAALAAMTAPAHAVVGVYDKYFVTTEATTIAPGGNSGYHWYNQRGSDIGSLPGAASGGSGTFSSTGSSLDTGGRLTAATSRAGSTGLVNGTPTPDANNTSANADLATARLRAAVVSSSPTGGFVSGAAFAQMHDIVTLNVAGASAATRTRVTVEYVVEGLITGSGPTAFGNPPSAQVEATISLNNPSSSQASLVARATTVWNPAQPATALPTLVGTIDQFTGAGNALGVGDVNGAGSWAGSTAARMVFIGSFDIIGSSTTLNPTVTLDLNCGWATCDYGTSFRFIDLPGNVTFTSNSGLFLSPVPEPGPWALMLAGLACVGFSGRRLRGARA